MNTFLGIIFLSALAMFTSTIFRDIGLSMVFNPDAVMIVVGGTLVAVFLAFPMKRLKSTAYDIVRAFRHQRSRQEISEEILEIARMHRRADIRGLEKRMKTMKDDFLKLGVNLLINHQSNHAIRNVMERELTIRVMDSNFSQNVLKTVARLTPSLGLAGTVISLIKMFRDMQSVEAIAPLMAVAMMSTFYGVIISNLFMLPLCAKLKECAILDEVLMHITIEGLEAVNDGEHPLMIAERLNGCCEEMGAFAPEAVSALTVTKSGHRA
jgi:chemotaxis protein MotA